MTFQRKDINVLPLAQRQSKYSIHDVKVDPDAKPLKLTEKKEVIDKVATQIVKARENGRPVILSYGAHLIKNGLAWLIARMVEEGYITHLATNGAGSIHDWEYAFQGRSEEDVRHYVKQGQFGIWDETGRYINLSILLGAAKRKGYGEAIGEFIETETLEIPELNELRMHISRGLEEGKTVTGLVALYEAIKELNLQPGKKQVPHPYKAYTLQNAAYKHNIPLTVHPGIGYDIIYTNPHCIGAAIGIASDIDFLKYVDSVSQLNGGVFLSVGSSVMGPMIFEKALSMARNTAKQKGETIEDFLIVVNDIVEGEWNWGSGVEPPKDDPAYYLRFCKTFDRMASREMEYLCLDNKVFLTNLWDMIKKKTRSPKIIDRSEIPALREQLRQQGKVVVTTNGTFDIMHVAHLRILQKAKAMGDVFIVMQNSDVSVKQNKGPTRPIIPIKERMEMMAGLECVDYIVPFDDKEALAMLDLVKPDIHVKGGTYLPERIRTEVELVESHGGKHICLPAIGSFSTSNIIKKIKETC